MNVGSIFSGIGGIELGFHWEGFKTEWFIEREPYAQTILRKRFPETPIYEDVTEVDFKTIPKTDIITGGFPCQDISNAGKRAGIEGSRSSLWAYLHKAISEIRPKYALIENVSALTHRGLDTVLCDLASIGYDAEWYCVPAAAVGAYHRRDRIFILAYPQLRRRLHRQTKKQSAERREYAQCNIGSESNYASYSLLGWKYWKQCTESLCKEVTDVQNTKRNRLRKRRSQDTSSKDNERRKIQRLRSIKADYISNASFHVLNTKSPRLQELWEPRESLYQEKNSKRKGDRFEYDCIWKSEPRLGRVANGIPNRMDRIKCIGNAVVPQVAQIFAQAIKEQINRS